MTCANCARGVSNFLEKKGLEDVHVSFSTNEVSFSPSDQQKLDDIIAGIESLGYEVKKEGEVKQEGRPRFSSLEKKFGFCLVFTIPLFLHMFFPKEAFINNTFVQLALCLPVFAVGMHYFGKSAFGSLKTGIPNMDVLITMGAGAAFIYSLAGTIMGLGHDFLFYETSATILTLVLLGNVIEHKSVEKTTTAISDLGKLQAAKAKKVLNFGSANEQVVEIEAGQVKTGEIISMNAGDKIPADGTVVWGSASVNEAMISGESMPVDKQEGAKVVGATLVESGNLKVKVSATGKETVLAHIIKLVKQAQKEKPMIQKLADRISGIFVPVVLAVSITTFIASVFLFNIGYTQALLNSIAVLVISCPCAMGLATPTAVMVGVGRVARNGILIKGGNTLETFAKIKQIVFDKTGTLTTGEFRVQQLIVYAGQERQEAETIIYNLELHSSHPIAKSLVRELENGGGGIEMRDIEEIRGKGMIGFVGTDRLEFGGRLILNDLKPEVAHDLYLLKNGRLIAGLDLKDELKPGALETVQYFKAKGVKTVLLSGDTYGKCSQVASELKMDEFYAEKLPNEKLEIINELVTNQPTAMVGDGINDAPSLSKATIGISLSNATDVAIQSAQIVLLNGKLEYLRRASAISAATLATIKQNLFWAFFYNVLAIPIAAVGLLNPMVAALSMAFSDVIVIGNSIRLKTRSV